MPITTADVINFIPTAGQFDNSLLQQYLDVVNTEADLQLNNIFADPFISVLETDLINYNTQNSCGSDFISISAWQPTNLTIKRTNIKNQNLGTLTEIPLILDEDYVYWYGWAGKKIPGKNLPITAIKLIKQKLSPNEILRIYGTYGWQEGYPSDIKQVLSNIVVSLASYADNPSNIYSGGAEKIKDLSTEIEFGAGYGEKLRNQARNIMNDPEWKNILFKYLKPFEQTVTIV